MAKKQSLQFGETLFSVANQEKMFEKLPLSARMRPQTLEEYVGQRHILSEGKLLYRAVESDRLSSVILYGPPGCGKTTLAQCIQKRTNSFFEKINAVASNVEDLRKVITASQHRFETSQKKTLLFIDEIHRFNKAQQDVLMPDLENGHLILIGATVMNPSFSLISPLISRSIVLELKPLETEDVVFILDRAVKDKEKGLGKLKIKATVEALEFIADKSDGDARKALNALEIGCLTTPPNNEGKIIFSVKTAQESIQKKQVLYDRDGDGHYDTASAFQKSMRGSDPDATLYWLAKMIYAGEDPRFISRRMCVCAAEDVGNADPQALVLATAAMQTAEFIGMPEARIPLAQAAIYIACAPKSNATIKGIDSALNDLKNNKLQEVPAHLKDAHYKGAKKMGHGQDYKYAHSYEENYVDQEYMPLDVKYYDPSNNGYEQKIKQRMEQRKSK